MKVCEVEDCWKKTKSRGLCPMHLNRFYRHGDVHTVVKRERERCSADGCLRDAYCRGLCGAHSERLRRFGDPLAWVPVGASRGELLEALAPPEPEPQSDVCVDCGGDPMPGGAIRCLECFHQWVDGRRKRRSEIARRAGLVSTRQVAA